MKTNDSLVPRDFMTLAQPTQNIYQSTRIIAKRAKQIAARTKEELHAKLADFNTEIDSLEEMYENKEHIEISKSYEKQPKPTLLATEEFLAGKIMFRHPDSEEVSSSL